MKLLLLFALLCIVPNCFARPDGAPSSACSSLTPSHGNYKAQKGGRIPYTVSAVKSGNKVKITITSPVGEQFEGFVLQARSKNDRTKFVNGEFTGSDVTKATDCFKGKKNTLTHANASPKKEVITEWTPSGAVNEDVVFRATVAKTFDVFWTEIDSSPVTMISDGDTEPSGTDAGKSSSTPAMYENCFESKGCFGFPSNCAQQGDCEVLLTYARHPNGIRFNLYGYLESKMYMAMGLSKDAEMGDDSVTACIRDGSDVIAQESWNEGKTNTRAKELPNDQYSSSFSEGLSFCTWTKPFNFSSNEVRYDLANNNYHVLVAKGQVENGAIRYHSGKLASSEPVNFTAFEAIEGQGVTDSVKVHGAFMVTAWVGFVSFAILLARHFKNTWEGSTLGGVKIWFALHRAFMVSGLLLVVIAFILIFVHKNGWNYETSNPHAILGCIATGLGLSNPIMATFRPGPDHSKRPVFNWFHWAVGNLAQMFAVIAIFFAVSLPSSGLKKGVYWVMAIFVFVHLIFHLLYQVLAWNESKKKNKEISLDELNGARSYTFENRQTFQANENKDKANVIRMFLLSFYTVFILVILLALYSLIGLA